jgi:Lipocalin-like domain
MRIATNFLAGLILATFAISCSVSKESRGMKKTINGNWVLQTITTEGITGVVKTKVFNEAEFSCFIGSEWNFISNNSMGSYTIVDLTKECPSTKRLIRWSIYEPENAPKEFQFKRLDDKKDPMDDGSGYRLTVVQLDDNNMKLRSNITFAGNPAAMIYNFVRK